MRVFGYVVVGLLSACAFLVLLLGIRLGSIHVEGFLASEREDVRRDVFENMRSYNQTKIQELADYRRQYLLATTDEQRDAVASTVRLRFADYEMDDRVPALLRDFWREINH